ncbi:hypothetical protein AB0H83_31300 [Dactylosporangium sp. NPDC050688]|uniref:hypothetical protein n=1 Tax=Dactylosporangium sp. NPDC050688 TaxID=3157217 RepID=UPI003409DEEF
MSLVVSVWLVDPDDLMKVRTLPPSDGEDSYGGGEDTRTTLWNSPAVVRRGARFLPWLADHNLYIEPKDVPAFGEECERLLADSAGLAAETECRLEQIERNLTNMLQVVARATSMGQGVVIW